MIAWLALCVSLIAIGISYLSYREARRENMTKRQAAFSLEYSWTDRKGDQAYVYAQLRNTGLAPADSLDASFILGSYHGIALFDAKVVQPGESIVASDTPPHGVLWGNAGTMLPNPAELEFRFTDRSGDREVKYRLLGSDRPPTAR